MKKTLLLFFILLSLKGYTQEFNNEWIDYTKTYYKFKVPTTGLYRINQPLLVTAGLANIPAEFTVRKKIAVSDSKLHLSFN